MTFMENGTIQFYFYKTNELFISNYYGVHDERCVLRILGRNICTGHHINTAQEI